MENLSTKAQEYKVKLSTLQAQKQDLERQVIILEEQHKSYQETIGKAFNTTVPEELRKIADSYLDDIKVLEEQLHVSI